MISRSRGLLPLALTALVVVAGCADIGARFIQPYRVEIQQGNFISSEQLANLRKDMSRDQVRFVLGTPTLQDIFHNDRWDYPFYIRRTSGEVLQRKLIVFFENDRLARWEADEMPSERPRNETTSDDAKDTTFNPADVRPDPPAPASPPRKPGA